MSVLRIQAMGMASQNGSRPIQEDYVVSSRDKGIFAVADGFGGPASGFEAAKLACESMRGFLEKEAGDQDATLPFVLRRYYTLAGNVLFNAVVHSNRRLLAQNHGKSVHEKGGASLLGGYLDGQCLALASVGNCSAWLLRNGRWAELIIPKCYSRMIHPESEPKANCRIPLTALGIAEDLEPEIAEYRVCPGDWLILQTDGATPGLRENLAKIRSQGLAPSEAVIQFQAAVKAVPFSDNCAISLVIF